MTTDKARAEAREIIRQYDAYAQEAGITPTPPETPAEMPECVRRLVEAVSPLIQQEGMDAIREAIDARDAVRDHYAKASTARDAEAEGLREAVRVLLEAAEESYRHFRSLSKVDQSVVWDAMCDHLSKSMSIAKAAIDAAGGVQ